MPPGPLPGTQTRRKNAPTIPTTRLPAGGRKGRPPNLPAGYKLGEAGQNWWRWAWATPQAAAWDTGSRYTIARRAQLEDDLAALGNFDPDSLNWIFANVDVENEDAFERALQFLGSVMGQLKRLAGDKLAVEREMRELDKRLGLDPKALAELRWTIVGDTPSASKPKAAPKAPAAAVPAVVDDGPRLRAV